MRVHGMPRPLSALLRSAALSPFAGPSRRLYAQARVLEYLSALYEHVRGVPARPAADSALLRKVHRLKGHLQELEGKLPTLEALARDFGVPARRLNEAFAQEFGQSIYAFITGHRLDQARLALRATDLPMKLLAERLGYSHVNHFITAFRKRFGQSPGQLRRGA